MTERKSYWRFAGEVGERQPDGRSVVFRKPGRPAAMLHIGPAVGAGGRQEEGVDDGEELAQIVRLPTRGPSNWAHATQAFTCSSLDRGQEHRVFGTVHRPSSIPQPLLQLLAELAAISG